VGLQYPEFTSVVIVLATYTGTFVAETVRSGFNVVSRGQAEAARSLGLSFLQVLRLVVLPQAIRSVVPPLGSVLIALIKNSAVAYFLGVSDLTFTAYYVGADREILLAFLIAAVGYLTLAIPTGLALGWVERRVALVR
jgi:glutamate transport system permease protein